MEPKRGVHGMISRHFCPLAVFFILTCCFSEVHATDFTLRESDKTYLLNLSRQTLYWYLKDGTIPTPGESTLNERIRAIKDCFVTLYKKDMGLRGCIGFGGPKPLYQSVINQTISAATRDPRFRKVAYWELGDIKIEISVLTVPKEIYFDSPQDLLEKIRANVDGVIIQTRFGQSTFIPKVWEQLPSKERFLSHLCSKHDAPSDTWIKENDNIRIWLYQAIAFGEKMYGRHVVGKNGAIVGGGGANLIGAVTPLPNGLECGKDRLPQGTELPAGAVVTPDSDIIDR